VGVCVDKGVGVTEAFMGRRFYLEKGGTSSLNLVSKWIKSIFYI
jgi:hypothetical protein